MGAEMRQRALSNGAGWSKSEGYFGRLGLMSVALMSDVLDSDQAKRAYRWLLAAAPPFTSPPDYAREPTMNIVPAGMPRLPDRALRCAPVRG